MGLDGNYFLAPGFGNKAKRDALTLPSPTGRGCCGGGHALEGIGGRETRRPATDPSPLRFDATRTVALPVKKTAGGAQRRPTKDEKIFVLRPSTFAARSGFPFLRRMLWWWGH